MSREENNKVKMRGHRKRKGLRSVGFNIDEDTYHKFYVLAATRGQSKSDFIRALIVDELAKADASEAR